MALSAEHTSKFEAPSPAMVTSPNERKILEWDEKLQINKQTSKHKTKYMKPSFLIVDINVEGLIIKKQQFMNKS